MNTNFNSYMKVQLLEPLILLFLGLMMEMQLIKYCWLKVHKLFNWQSHFFGTQMRIWISTFIVMTEM